MPQIDRIGMGGGGALFDPQVALWNKDLFFVACDMTGLYRSIDSGAHWTLLDTRVVQGSKRLSVTIHSTAQRILGYHPFQGVKESIDGLSWTEFSPNAPLHREAYPTNFIQSTCVPPGNPPTLQRGLVVTALSYCPDVSGRILAGTECGIFFFDEQTGRWQWSYPLNAAGAPSRFPTFNLGQPGTTVPANAAEVISFLPLRNPHSANAWMYFCATSCAVLRSDDAGRTWQDVTNNLPTRPLGVYAPGLPSGDQVANSTVDPNYHPTRVRGIAGGFGPASAVGGSGNHAVVYVTVATSLSTSVPPVEGGIYAYDTLDDPSTQPNLTPTWVRVMNSGINLEAAPTTAFPTSTTDDRSGFVIPRYERLAVSRGSPENVYVSAVNTFFHYPWIYRGRYSRPGNQPSVAWMGVYNGFQRNTSSLTGLPGSMSTNLDGNWIEDDLGWGFGGVANGLTADPNDADRIVLVNAAAVHLTENGTSTSPTWSCRYSDEIPDTTTAGNTGSPWWRTTGLDVTTSWHYHISPAAAGRHFIANTDIGLSQSINAGDTWRSLHPGCDLPSKPPWSNCSLNWNNIYELAFDGANVWAAASQQHDLPHDDRVRAGAVLLSSNNGDTWQELTSAGLPPTGSPPSPTRTSRPVTSVLRDAGVTYIALWRGGVFQLPDGASQWTEVAVPGATSPNRSSLAGLAAYRLQFSGQTLYCVVSDSSAEAGLYAFHSGQGWTPVGPVGQFRVIDFAVRSVGGSDQAYLCTGDKGSTTPGAVYKLTGTAWTSLGVPFAAASNLHDTVVVVSISFVGDMAYVGSITHGLWCARLSDLDGFTGTGMISWIQHSALPFLLAQRVVELGDPSSGTSTLLLTSYGGGVGRIQRSLSFVVDRGQFTQGEVSAASTDPAPFPLAMFVVADGFLPIELLNARTPNDLVNNLSLQVTPSGQGVTITPGSPQVLLEDPALPADRFQRIAFPLTVNIAKNAMFPQQVTIRATYGRYSCTAILRLVIQPVPFMVDGPTPWLSGDVAVFQVREGETVFGQTLTPGKSGVQFIRDILDAIRTSPSTWEAEFEGLRDGPKNILQLSERDPATSSPTFNFALARVRNADPNNSATGFSVFFRLFNTAWTGLEYDSGQSYRTATNVSPAIPVLGVKTGPGQGGALVTVPCFAADRKAPSDTLSSQTDPYNAAGASSNKTIGPGGIQFYGCWLDFNQPKERYPQFPGTQDGQFTGPLKSIQELVRGRHQCLAVEVFRSTDIIPNGATPGTSDRLSQRNLFIVGCDNPGPPPAHTVVHTFEVKAPMQQAAPPATGGDEGEVVRRFGETDELVVFAGTLPKGARIRITLAKVSAEQLLQAQADRLGAVRLRKVDDRTLEFEPGHIATIALPAEIVTNLPGLLSVQVPEGVRAGEQFSCRLQQWSNGKVLGQFEVRIPVAPPQALLLEEENTLAVLQKILSGLNDDDPWREPFEDYVRQTAERVSGLGGNPDAVRLSRTGQLDSPDFRRPGAPHSRRRRLVFVIAALGIAGAVGALRRLRRRGLR